MSKSKLVVPLVLLVFLLFGASGVTLAKTDPVKALKAQVTSLQKQVKTLKTQVTSLQKQNATLKSERDKARKELKELNTLVTNVKSGAIYRDGVNMGSSSFVTVNDTTYADINQIIPILTSLKDNNFKYVPNKNELYLGVMPQNGMISLSNYPVYTASMDDSWNKLWYGSTSINGERYTNGIAGRIYRGESNYTYKLDSKYSKLLFKVGLDDNSKNGLNGIVKVYGDGNVIYDSGNLQTLEPAKEVELDISGIKMLSIVFSGNRDSVPVVANPILIP